MRRVNTFEVVPQTENDKECLFRLLDASASLWNELTYERRQNYFGDGNVWDTSEYRGRYNGVVGSATVQQVTRKNSEAWRSFFSLKEKGENANPPSYWGNKENGRELRTYIRNNQYTIQWGKRSRLEIPVGQELKNEYGLGYHERLRLKVRGKPKWKGDQGRLELEYDDINNTFRAFQPVDVPDSRLDSPLASEKAALSVGANDLIACSTTTGKQYIYSGRKLFRRFHKTTHEIIRLQSKLEKGQYSSKRIRRLYRKRTSRRDHAQNALVRDLVERLYYDGVATVYIDNWTQIVKTHWSVNMDEKTHSFWPFKAFIHRLACVCEEYGIGVEVQSEAWVSQRQCLDCIEEKTDRHKDTTVSQCEFKESTALKTSKTFLQDNYNNKIGLMAQPVRFEWDNHKWSEKHHLSLNDGCTNPKVTSMGQ